MRIVLRLLALIGVVSAVAFAFTDSPATAGSGSGVLAGRTLITFGCPGPARVGIACPRWHLFPHARFTVRQVGPAGQPMPQIVRLVVSDARARFAIRLGVGDYRITPLAQPHTRGGKSITVHVSADSTTRITLRYLGYPVML